MAELPTYLRPTFGERQKSREGAEDAVQSDDSKSVDAESAEVEDKAVKPAATKRKGPRKRS